MTEYNQEGQAIAPVVVRWVEALRSGDYAQAKKYLHVGTGFCCLGVLEDLDGDAGWEQVEDVTGDARELPVFATKHGDTGFPGCEVLEWADLSVSAAEHLANLNDNGKTFAEIADEIERMYAEGVNVDRENV